MGSPFDAAGASHVGPTAASQGKSFLLLFFKKEALPFFLSFALPTFTFS
jgi:hypothetical protein